MTRSAFTNEADIFRAHVVALREKAGLTQRELADRLGAYRSFVSRTEQGERRLDFVELLWICRACKADPVRTARQVMAALARLPNPSPIQVQGAKKSSRT